LQSKKEERRGENRDFRYLPLLEAEEKRKGNEVGCGPSPGYATVPITAGSLCGHAAAAVADVPVLPL